MAIYLGNTLLTGPSGGTGDAVLADDQTFTGANTFSDTTIFSDASTNGSMQIADRITHLNDTNTHIRFQSDRFDLVAGGIDFVIGSSSFIIGNSLIFNNSRDDVNFLFNKNTSGTWLEYDGGGDTMTVGADNFTVTSSNITGVAGSESGTWTPTFTGGGTQGTTTATYSKTGSTVIAQASVFIAPGTIPQPFALSPSSLPFSDNSPSNAAIGTYFVAATNNSLSQSNSGVVASGTATSIVFLDNVREDELAGTEIRGYIGFTLTYQTND